MSESECMGELGEVKDLLDLGFSTFVPGSNKKDSSWPLQISRLPRLSHRLLLLSTIGTPDATGILNEDIQHSHTATLSCAGHAQ